MVCHSKIQLSALYIFEFKVNKAVFYNLVYRFKCNGCYSICYSRTVYHSKVRVCGHLGINPSTGKGKMPKKRCNMRPFFHRGHYPSFYDFGNILKNYHEFRLLYRLSLLISRDEPHLYKHNKSILLSAFS